jgi:predicted RNA-binding protein with RPS1 domain
MLEDYSKETGIKIDAKLFAEKLFYYTSGYPFLVSRLCQIIDEKIKPEKVWTLDHLLHAVQLIVREDNTNFMSLVKNLEDNQDLYRIVYETLIEGKEHAFNIHNPLVNIGVVYGVFSESVDHKLRIHNLVYAQVISNYMSSKTELSIDTVNYNYRDNFLLPDGGLDFRKVLQKFQEFMKMQYSEKDQDFLERNGRLILLAFLKPIINGKGFDFKETQVSEEKRLDVVITYGKFKYVVELKLWLGEEAHTKGKKQLADYLQREGVDEGFLVMFNKNKKKEWKSAEETVNGKKISMVWV